MCDDFFEEGGRIGQKILKILNILSHFLINYSSQIKKKKRLGNGYDIPTPPPPLITISQPKSWEMVDKIETPPCWDGFPSLTDF